MPDSLVVFVETEFNCIIPSNFTLFFSLSLSSVSVANILRTFCPDEWNYALLTLYSFTNLGLGASFGVSEFVCLYIKLYALMALLLVAIIPMKVCEIRLVRLEKILGPGSASQVWLLANDGDGEEEAENGDDFELGHYWYIVNKKTSVVSENWHFFWSVVGLNLSIRLSTVDSNFTRAKR